MLEFKVSVKLFIVIKSRTIIDWMLRSNLSKENAEAYLGFCHAATMEFFFQKWLAALRNSIIDAWQNFRIPNIYKNQEINRLEKLLESCNAGRDCQEGKFIMFPKNGKTQIGFWQAKKS